MSADRRFWGFRRENGRVGVRNHVAILPVDDISNAACEAVANNIQGTIALPHAYGRLQFGADLDLHFRTMIGTGSNPNVAACVVIGIEPGWTQKIVDGIAETLALAGGNAWIACRLLCECAGDRSGRKLHEVLRNGEKQAALADIRSRLAQAAA